ncbi:endoglucanase-4 [Apiospora phragmitis]|uniref:lytic cellulose monooxygenase (C4-dehydrogenating) n=1 Tax=Apiospora phragmitis TaxID=2905665 RepID=A0ABR1UZL7_9PEZI
MSTTKLTLAAVGAFAATALAHGNVNSFSTDDKKQQGFLMDYYYQAKNGGSAPKVAAWSTENLDNGFIDPTMYKTSDINCHKKAQPGALTSSVKAGGEVSFDWGNWPHDIGPVLTYVADCGGDCSKTDKTALKWVKIDESGYEGGKWGAAKLVANGGTWTTKVPENLKAGNYVFRHEIIALHAAGQENGAQNYPQCINIAVTGSGTELPEGTLGTDLYTSKDAGILFNPYQGTISSYTVPGPKLFGTAGGGGGGGAAAASSAAPAPSASAPAATQAPPAASTTAAAPAPTQSAGGDDNDACEAQGDDEDDEGDDDACEAQGNDEGDDDACEPEATSVAPVPTTLVTATRTSAAPAAPTGDAGSSQGASLYGQCGGNGFTGPTSCAEGTCKKQNAYYSQCLN